MADSCGVGSRWRASCHAARMAAGVSSLCEEKRAAKAVAAEVAKSLLRRVRAWGAAVEVWRRSQEEKLSGWSKVSMKGRRTERFWTR